MDVHGHPIPPCVTRYGSRNERTSLARAPPVMHGLSPAAPIPLPLCPGEGASTALHGRGRVRRCPDGKFCVFCVTNKSKVTKDVGMLAADPFANPPPFPLASSQQEMAHMPLATAADKLGVSPTAIKKACRKLGVFRWPMKFGSSSGGNSPVPTTEWTVEPASESKKDSKAEAAGAAHKSRKRSPSRTPVRQPRSTAQGAPVPAPFSPISKARSARRMTSSKTEATQGGAKAALSLDYESSDEKPAPAHRPAEKARRAPPSGKRGDKGAKAAALAASQQQQSQVQQRQRQHKHKHFQQQEQQEQMVSFSTVLKKEGKARPIPLHMFSQQAQQQQQNLHHHRQHLHLQQQQQHMQQMQMWSADPRMWQYMHSTFPMANQQQGMQLHSQGPGDTPRNSDTVAGQDVPPLTMSLGMSPRGLSLGMSPSGFFGSMQLQLPSPCNSTSSQTGGSGGGLFMHGIASSSLSSAASAATTAYNLNRRSASVSSGTNRIVSDSSDFGTTSRPSSCVSTTSIKSLGAEFPSRTPVEGLSCTGSFSHMMGDITESTTESAFSMLQDGNFTSLTLPPPGSLQFQLFAGSGETSRAPSVSGESCLPSLFLRGFSAERSAAGADKSAHAHSAAASWLAEALSAQTAA